MTDQELIALLDERRPHEWTPDEIARLRERLPHSPELRAALHSELALEAGLQEQLGKYDVPIDAILAKAAGKQAGWRLGLLLGWTAAAVVLTAGLLYWNGAFDSPVPIAQVEATAETTPEASPEPSAAGTLAATAEATPAAPQATGEGSPSGMPTPEATPRGTPIPVPIAAPEPEVRLVLREADLFEDFVRLRVPPTEDELKKLVVPVAGALRFYQGPDRSGTGIEGQGQLALPNGKWPAGATLRLAMFELQNFRIHAWSGLAGATFTFQMHDQQGWAGYITSREQPGETRPKRYGVTGSDESRWHRLGDGWVDLRYEDGRLKLCRSDVMLVEVPLAEPPTQLVFDGHVCFRGIEWVEAAPLPVPPSLAVQTVYRSVEPERLPWTTQLPGDAKFAPLSGGAVRLERAGKNEADAFAGAVVDRPGMYAVDFLVEDPQPGTGVYLGDATGKPIVKLGFSRDRRSNATVMQWVSVWDANTETEFDPNHHAVPFAGPRQWVRILLGANVARCYVSGDGRRWSAVLDGYRQQNSGNTRLGGVVSSGVYLLRGDGARTITLREMAVAEPTGLRDAPGSAVAEQAFAFAFAADAGEWMKLVVENKPVGVDPIAWRCACAYKTLAHGPDPKLVSALWAGLIEDSLRLAPTFDARLAVLDAATAATSLGWEMPDAKPWFERYEALGAELIQSGDPAPWSKLRLPMIYSPLQARAWFDVEPAPLVRQELLELVGKGDWAGVRDVSRKIWAANLPIHPHQRMPHNRGKAERRNVLDLTEWADAIASRALPRQAGETVAISVDWRRPLVEQLSKEGYNLLAEFEAALKSKSYRDACQIVASCSPGAALGVAPDSQDPALMVSLPSAVALAMRETPDLQRTMEKEFGAVGKFRIREATGDADADAVEAATVQFFGTAAAAEAHVWLGDRALATGDFAAAGSQYRRAAETLGGKPSPSLEARRRLTAAFQGREYGTPVAAPVVLGDKTLDATAFEALVSAARTRSERAASLGDAAPLGSADAPPPPSEYTAKAFAQTSGEWGREHERLASKNVNAVGRLTTTLVAGNLFITHNRFQTIAFDLGSGQQKWSTGLGGQQGHAHKWTTPMRPLLVQGKLIVRRLTENGPELAAIELETGKVLWRQQPGHHVASDPLWIQQELFALGVSSVGSDQLQLELVSFALDTGEPVARRKLALFRNAWNSAIPCSAAASGDRIVAAAGGAVLCTDLLGQVLWLREQNWIPAKQDEAAGRLGVSTPIIADRRVYVSQPNVRTVDCLDLDGGRLQWRRTYEALQGLIGLAGPKRDVLVVALDEALEGVKLADGGSLWRRSGRLDLEGTVAGADSVLTVERIPTNNEQHRVQLSWLDPQSGKELASVPLAGTDQVKVEGRWPQVGPTVAAGGRYWVYFNAEERSPERKILEITATGPAPAQSPVDAGAAKYAQLSRRLIGEAAGFSPRWMLLASPENQRAGRQAQWENHPNVMLTYCTNEAATSWGGFVTLSADKPATLHLEVGHVNDAPYRVVVNAAGRTLGEWVVSPETAPSHWLTIDADLSSLAGRTTWVEIRQEPFQKRDSLAAWQKMEIVAP